METNQKTDPTSGHTPTPWEMIPGREVKTAKRQSGTLWHDNGTEDGYTIGGLETILPANAALIVRAVNAHEALVAALTQGLANEGQDGCCLRITKNLCYCWRCKARAALKLAKGEA